MIVKKVTLAELQPGMILGQQITDDNGRTIMQEDARLTPMHIKRLEKWGIDSVSVKVQEKGDANADALAAGKAAVQEASSEDRDRMRNVAAAVQQRFSNVAEDAVMEELKRLTVRHLVLQGGKPLPGLD